jgi:TonB family protein
MSVIRRFIGIVLAASLAKEAQGQELIIPESAYLVWSNLRMVISPDKEGTFLWVNSGYMKREKDGQFFSGTFRPDEVDTWVSDARWFLDQDIPKTDTGTTRVSATLEGRNGRVYLARRKRDGAWTQERLIVMQSPGNRPVIVSGGDGDARTILDSLLAVAHRAPAPEANQRPSLREMVDESRDSLVDKPVSPKSSNRPPLYPQSEREVNHEGMVLLSFVVGVDGAADLSTVNVIHATSRAFLTATMTALPRLRFAPAQIKGVPVRQRVMMPFQFALLR